MASGIFFLFITIPIFCLLQSSSAMLPHSSFYLPATNKTTWTNNSTSFPHTRHFSDGSLARFLLFKVVEYIHIASFEYPYGNYGLGFCFYCMLSSCYLSIIFVDVNNGSIVDTPPQVVWSANREQPVRENAVVTFFHNGDLVLADADGSPVWSSNTSLQSVAGISISKQGNLVLFNQSKGTVWQSFDHPTDTLLLGQILKEGQQLTSRVTSNNMSSGLFYLSIDQSQLSAYATVDSPMHYLTVNTEMSRIYQEFTAPHLNFVEFRRGKLNFLYRNVTGLKGMEIPIKVPVSSWLSTAQIMRLDADGGLRIYGWVPLAGWKVILSLSDTWDECQLPLKCGKYGVCQDGQCTCPPSVDGISFFEPVDSRFPNLGCSHKLWVTSDSYQLVNFGQLSYFTAFNELAATPGLESEESCVQACALKESSCQAAFFMYHKKGSKGYCYLVSEVLSIIGTPISHKMKYHVSSYIKVQVPPPSHATAYFPISRLLLIVMVIFACVPLFVTMSLLKRRRRKYCEDEACLDNFLSKTLLRFSYSELSVATDNFSKKLGGGGFGQVFRGALRDGTEIAVKRLESTGQGTKEFLAEMETGNIHHINLVKLIGFCVENMHRIIIYEYLSNGSLDKWIFHKNENDSLDWKTRKKILFHVAKGLAYIHEECRQKIAHLDVKPHNILLDDNFNAKISDFGMSKLISRDESQVMTRIRGTLGYLAPEWQGSRITVKADIYSYGILLLEVVSGRMVLDYSQPEPEIHLLKLLQKKSIENQLMDIVDSKSEDMIRNSEEGVEMIKLGLWCLHNDYRRRPAMSSVVKVLEGSLELETNFTYNFSSALSPVCSHAKRC